MTCLRVNSDLLMSMLYLASLPSLPVKAVLSDPAKSTSSILLLYTKDGSSFSKHLTLIVRMVWLLEELILSLWEPLTLLDKPTLTCCRSSWLSWHSYTNKFSTVNCSSLFHLKRRLFPLLAILGLKLPGLSRS